MKRILIMVVLVIVVIGTASASTLTFQNTSEFTDIDGVLSASQVNGSENNYYNVYAMNGYVRTKVYTGGATYGAATVARTSSLISNPSSARILVTDGSDIISCDVVSLGNGAPVGWSNPFRISWSVSGGTLTCQPGGDTHAITFNPIRTLFTSTQSGSVGFDTIIMAGTDSHYVLELPETATYTGDTFTDGYRYEYDSISHTGGLKDPAGNDYGDIIFGQWSKDNDGVYDTVDFTNMHTGTIYQSNFTGVGVYYNGTANVIGINATSVLVDSGAPFGTYVLSFRGKNIFSNPLYYTGAGASIGFDSAAYTTSSTPIITWVMDGSHYQPSSYTYKWNVTDVYGTPITSGDITSASGSTAFSFPSGTSTGVIFVTLDAKPTLGTTQTWAWDYATVGANFAFSGYVTDQYGIALSGANVTMTQGTTTEIDSTDVSGYYSTDAVFTPSTSMTINVTMADHRQWYVNVIPIGSRISHLNFTLPTNNITPSGLGIGGIAYAGSITGTTLTGGMGNPITDATIYVQNLTTSEVSSTLTNSSGWYIRDANSIVLTSGRPYTVFGSKTGYANSSNYVVVPS